MHRRYAFYKLKIVHNSPPYLPAGLPDERHGKAGFQGGAMGGQKDNSLFSIDKWYYIFKKKYLFFLALLFCCAGRLVAADYYWVGNSGNWSDFAAHWATTSGGATFHTAVPTTSDNVFFDANSFSAGGQTATINVSASCANLDFSGALNAPTITGTSSYILTCAGSLTFIAGITYSFAGDVHFTGTGVHTITSAGQSFAANVLFNGTGGQWTLQDAFSVTSQLGLQAGTLDMNGVAVSCGTLNANIVDNARTLTFGASTVTITGSSTCVDLRGNTANLVINAGTATISCITTSNLTIQVGTQTKTIPNLLFPNITTGNITITSGTSTNRITFGTITKSTAPGTLSNTSGVLSIDGSSTSTTKKTFGNISIPDNCTVDIAGGSGTAFGTADGVIFAGTITVGDGGQTKIYADYATYQQPVTFGENIVAGFYFRSKFDATITIGSTSTNAVSFPDHFYLGRNHQVDGAIVVNGNSTIQLDFYNGAASNFNSTVTVADDATLTLTLERSYVANFNGNFTVGNRSGLIITDDGTAGSAAFGATFTCNSGASISLQNTVATLSFNNLTLSGYNTVFFNALSTPITGTFTSATACNNWNWIGSVNVGTQALVSFTSGQTVTGLLCQDMNISSANLTNNNGVDIDNNTGITFGTPITTQTFYWVGGTTGNTKLGTNSTGVNNDWSNPDNWSVAGSGVYTGTNACIPGAQDHVIFDASSFSAGAADVNVDGISIFANNLTWTGIPAGVTFDNGSTTDTRILFVYGNFIWGGSNMTNNFEGTTLFSAVNTTGLTITNNGTRFLGPVEFDYPGMVWTLADNMDNQGGVNGDITITTGTLSVGNSNITLDDDWTVETSGTYSFTGGGTATITFDGATTTGEQQYITIDGTGIFNNLTVTRVAGVFDYHIVDLATPITINKNLSITGGTLRDNGFQITGNATGTLTMSAGTATRLILGATTLSTLFPTAYTAGNISLATNSIVDYNSSIDQTISGVPDYGTLRLTNTTASLKTKTLTEAVTINTSLDIDNYNHLVDAGFQISFDGAGTNTIAMDPDSKFTIGTAASATTFPPNFTATAVDLDNTGNGCTIVYNGGVAQTIQSLSNGTGIRNYSHLELVQPGVGSVTKSFNGNMLVRGNITIGANNIMDVSDPTYTFTVNGNWTDNGSFTAITGAVTFNGTNQTINSGGNSETFYDVTLNNTTTTISSGNVTVSNTLTFTAGKVVLGTNNLIISSGNAIVGYSSSNYVVTDNTGVLQINNLTASRDFPIGTSTSSYTPINIVNAGVADNFTARVFAEVYHEGTSGAQQTSDVVRKTWMVDEGTPGASDVTLTAQWNAADEYGTFDRSACGISHYTSGNWDTPAYAAAAGANPYTISRSSITSFSPFAVEESSHPLPIKLLDFYAEKNGDVVDLFWITATETNNDYFTIERTTDGINFENIAFVEGAGTSFVTIEYKAKDLSPVYGIIYYRLKQTDYDGKYSYSKLVAVEIKNSSSLPGVFPNPFDGEEFYVALPDTDDNATLVELYDVHGKKLFSEKFLAGSCCSSVAVSLSSGKLASGMYMLTIFFKNEFYIQKLIVK